MKDHQSQRAIQQQYRFWEDPVIVGGITDKMPPRKQSAKSGLLGDTKCWMWAVIKDHLVPARVSNRWDEIDVSLQQIKGRCLRHQMILRPAIERECVEHLLIDHEGVGGSSPR